MTKPTEKAKSVDSGLLTALDTAAKHLLEKAGMGGKLDLDGTLEPAPPLVEQVKAFQAVVDYAKSRADMAPAEKKDSPFASIRESFNGETPERRRGRAAKQKTGTEPLAASVAGSQGLFDA